MTAPIPDPRVPEIHNALLEAWRTASPQGPALTASYRSGWWTIWIGPLRLIAYRTADVERLTERLRGGR